jgi:phosphatidate cytidylyltransferase
MLGKHKMAPKVSPNKTWEGAAAGLIGAVAGASALWALRIYGDLDALPNWPLWRYMHAGALVSIVAQIGDLTESCLKRDAGVKDSGNFFPGHGGVLDRTDGFLFAAPVLYYLVTPLFGP